MQVYSEERQFCNGWKNLSAGSKMLLKWCGLWESLRIDEEMVPTSSSYTRTSHQGCDYFLSKKASDFTVVYAQTSL